MEERIKRFTEKVRVTTEDGIKFASPLYYWKRKASDEWISSSVTCLTKRYLRKVNGLPYTYLWVFANTGLGRVRVII